MSDVWVLKADDHNGQQWIEGIFSTKELALAERRTLVQEPDNEGVTFKVVHFTVDSLVKKPGHAFKEKVKEIACETCKGKGEIFDCEDEEMMGCPRCHGTGMK